MSRLWVRCVGSRGELSGCCFRWASFMFAALAVTGSRCCRQASVCRCRPIHLSGSATGWMRAPERLVTGRLRGWGRRSTPPRGARSRGGEGDSFVFTGRLSLATHPWLAGHVVFGAVLLPGTAFVELALAAAERVGLDTIEELTIEAPLVVPERGAVQLQLLVGALDEGQRRSLSLHARVAGDSEAGRAR